MDTVKQAEVFAAVRERFGVERDDNLRLRDFPTLAHVIGWIREKTDRTAPAAVPAAEAEPAAPEPASLHVAPTVTGDLAATDRVPRRVPVPVLRPDLSRCTPTGGRPRRGQQGRGDAGRAAGSAPRWSSGCPGSACRR